VDARVLPRNRAVIDPERGRWIPAEDVVPGLERDLFVAADEKERAPPDGTGGRALFQDLSGKRVTEPVHRPARRFVSAFTVAAVYVGLDDREKAFEWLEKAYEERSDRLVHLGIERAFDPLCSDPRFRDLVRRIRLPL
jgi:hypothetical protein